MSLPENVPTNTTLVQENISLVFLISIINGLVYIIRQQ